MKLLYLVCLVGLWASGAHAATGLYDPSKSEPSESDLVQAGILPGYEGDSTDLDYEKYQYEPKKDGEVEGDSARDEAFDCELTDETGRPEEPKSEEIAGVCEEGKQSIARQASRGGIDVYSENTTCTRQPNPFTYFVDRKYWVPYLKCCPKTWGYGCRHINARMPCFLNFYKNAREWCCPLWPQPTIARCLCDKCAIQTKSCVHLGRCHKRYSRKNFVAVCYRFGWKYLRYFSKWVPSSCYCRAG